MLDPKFKCDFVWTQLFKALCVAGEFKAGPLMSYFRANQADHAMQVNGLEGCDTDGSWLRLSSPCGAVQIDSQDPGVQDPGARSVSILCTLTPSAQCSIMNQYPSVASQALPLPQLISFTVKHLYTQWCTLDCFLSRSTENKMASSWIGIHGV